MISVYTAKRPVCNLKRAITTYASPSTQECAASATAPKRHIYLLKRALDILKRAPHMSSVYTEKRPICNFKRAITTYASPLTQVCVARATAPKRYIYLLKRV